jgi:hypothetical protein
MSHNFPYRPKERILQGVKIVDGKPYMQEDSEMRWVYGKPYYNTSNGEIRIR